MKVALKLVSNGKFVTGWDTGQLRADRDNIGAGETFELVVVEADPPVAAPPPQPQPAVYPAYPGADPRNWFMGLVADKPFSQRTLTELEPVLNANGWLLTPPNAVGDRTKIHFPGGVWTRVGFGEGYWVWLEQREVA